MGWLSRLVEEYRNTDGLADIFGLILYTDENANLKKVLRDKDYWDSFDETSGKKWAVFSVRPIKGSVELPNPPHQRIVRSSIK